MTTPLPPSLKKKRKLSRPGWLGACRAAPRSPKCADAAAGTLLIDRRVSPYGRPGYHYMSWFGAGGVDGNDSDDDGDDDGDPCTCTVRAK